MVYCNGDFKMEINMEMVFISIWELKIKKVIEMEVILNLAIPSCVASYAVEGEPRIPNCAKIGEMIDITI